MARVSSPPCARSSTRPASTSWSSARAARPGRSPWRRPSPERPRSPSSTSTAERGAALARLLDERTPTAATFVPWNGPYRLPESADVVVNATPIGLFPDVDGRLDLDLDSLRPHQVVADVIPNPPSTPLLRDAAARGCQTLDGLGMLVNQGVLGIKLWTGVDADRDVMADTSAARACSRRGRGTQRCFSRRTRGPAWPRRS